MQRIVVPEVGNIDIEYSRRKTVLIRVLPVHNSAQHNAAKVQIVAPLRADISQIQQIISKRLNWINKKQKFYSDCEFLNRPLEYKNGEKVLFRGKKLRLMLVKSNIEYVVNTENNLMIYLKNPLSASTAEKMLSKWFREKASYIFHVRTIELSKLLEDRHSKTISVSHRSMKRQWGSCSAGGKITLNTQLIKTPPECLDYVIIHELCHLVVMNHSKKYYSLLDNLLPDWKARQKALRRYTCMKIDF